MTGGPSDSMGRQAATVLTLIVAAAIIICTAQGGKCVCGCVCVCVCV